MGHEFSGIITAVHESVKSRLPSIQPGTRVAIHPLVPDWSCKHCSSGYRALCPETTIRGMSAAGGATSLLNVDARACYPVPDNVPLDIATMVEPIACAWQGVKTMKVRPDSKILVIGTGPIGIATLECLKERGVDAATMMVVGRSTQRNEWAKALGVKHLFATTDGVNVVAKAKEIFDDGGPEIVFDTASTEETFTQGLESLQHGGGYCSFGIFHQDKISFDANLIWWKGLTVAGIRNYDDKAFSEVIDAMAHGRLDLKRLRTWITKAVEMEGTNDALIELEKNKSKHMKVLVRVSGEL